MRIRKSKTTIWARAEGRYALWTRAQNSVERLTHLMATPTGMQGMLGSIYVKRREFEWRVLRIIMLNPPKTRTFLSNEINALPDIRKWGAFSTTEHRTQRYSTVLVDVDYVVEATPVRSWLVGYAGDAGPHLGPKVDVRKHVDIFNRYVERGAHFAQPFLGVREFPAMVDKVADGEEIQPFPLDMDLGPMPLKMQYTHDDLPTELFPARLRQGVLSVPKSKGARR